MANADDQGRLSADPHHLKWEVCPNVEEITPQEIPGLLAEMCRQKLVCAYEAQGHPVVQLLTWWEAQASMQWAYPSDFIPPEGWDDRLRFRRFGRVITINWPGSANGSKDIPLSELARQLSFSESLNIALGKTIGKPIGKLQKEKEKEKETTPPVVPPLALSDELPKWPRWLGTLQELEGWPQDAAANEDVQKKTQDGFGHLNLEEEAQKFVWHWQDSRRKLKSARRAWWNWLGRAKGKEQHGELESGPEEIEAAKRDYERRTGKHTG